MVIPNRIAISLRSQTLQSLILYYLQRKPCLPQAGLRSSARFFSVVSVFKKGGANVLIVHLRKPKIRIINTALASRSSRSHCFVFPYQWLSPDHVPDTPRNPRGEYTFFPGYSLQDRQHCSWEDPRDQHFRGIKHLLR